MKLNTRHFRAIPLLAVLLASILACSHNPPAYTPPVRIYKKEPAKAAQANMQLAIEYMKLGQLATARECIERALNEDARNPLYQTPEVALVNAGVCVRSAGDLVDAEKYFNRALAIRPNMPEGLLQLGNVEFDRGDAQQALDIVQRYLALNKPTPEILWLGFRAQRKLGDSVAAAVFARRVQTEFPNSAQAQNMRSGVDR
jgi:type IV pilus assembly protein PilF